MAVTLNLKISGTRRVMKAFRTLSGGRQRKAIRTALAKAATPMVREVKRNAPVQTGALKRSIGRKTETRGQLIRLRLGPKADYVGPGNRRPVRYAHLVELGHGGPGPAPAKPFMRPALQAKREEVKQIFSREFAAAVLRIAAQQRRR